jgi:hypothetical protein
MIKLRRSEGMEISSVGLGNRCGEILKDLENWVKKRINEILAESNGGTRKLRPAYVTIERIERMKQRGHARQSRFR